jgi:hypothetical protein
MTVLRSASGSRIDCDECPHHAAAASLSIEALRRAMGYVNRDGRDLCPSCWCEYTASRFGRSFDPPTAEGPPAAYR